MRAGIKPQQREYDKIVGKAMGGDMVFTVFPATDTPAPTADAWEHPIFIKLQTAAGELHEWYNSTLTTAIAASDTSTAGTASVGSTTLSFVDGVAIAVLQGDAAAWLDGETATATIAEQTIMGNTIAEKTCVLTFTTP